MAVTIPNGAILTLYTNNNAALALNVIGARVTGAVQFNQALATALGSAIKSAWTTNIAPLCNASTQLVRVGIRDMRTAAQPEYRDLAAAVAGTDVAADSLPQQVAFCITLRTALSGKSFRGRIYYCGFNEAQNQANGTARSAVAANCIAMTNAIDSALTANGLDLAVLSRPAERYTISKTTFHADGSSTTDIIGRGNARSGGAEVVTIVESRNASFETQRRRSNGRGITPTSLDALDRLVLP